MARLLLAGVLLQVAGLGSSAPTAKQCAKWAKRRRCTQHPRVMQRDCPSACVQRRAHIEKVLLRPDEPPPSDNECFEIGYLCKREKDQIPGCPSLWNKCHWVGRWAHWYDEFVEKLHLHTSYSPLFFENESETYWLAFMAVNSGQSAKEQKRQEERLQYHQFWAYQNAELEMQQFYGLKIVHRFRAPVSDTTIEHPTSPRAILHQPESGSSDCPERGVKMEIVRYHSSHVLALVRNAAVTFEGLVISESGAIISTTLFATAMNGKFLLDLLGASDSIRLARSCPDVAGSHRACFRTTFPPQQLALHAFGKKWPMTSFLWDELEAFSPRLQECPEQPQQIQFKKLLSWQHVDAQNYYHFLAQNLPRLLALLDEVPTIVRDPEMRIHAAVDKRFVKDVLELLKVETVPYDPCAVYTAKEVYVMVETSAEPVEGRITSGNQMHTHAYDWGPTWQHISAVRDALYRSIPEGALEEASAPPLNGKCLAIFLDRIDAKKLYQKERPPQRSIVNRQEVADAIEPALADTGIKLEVVVSPGSVVQQIAKYRQSCLLLGAHGAGLTNMIFMKEQAAIVELVPAAPGQTGPLTVFPEPHTGHCGFTSLWHLSQTCGHHYYAVLMLQYSQHDAFRVDAAPLASYLKRIAKNMTLENFRLREEL